jgi:signal transduction histidine kinase
MVTCLLLLLTYLLVQSRSPGQESRTRAQEALQALQLSDAALNRAVLMIRAGLLQHYDRQPRLAAGIVRQVDVLEREAAALASAGDATIAREAADLAAACARKRRLVEHFTSDNAVLRNSSTYFAYLLQQLGAAGSRHAAALEGSHTLMQFLQAPGSVSTGQQAAALAAIEAAAPTAPGWRPLAAHGRLIVELLPRVDEGLRAILAVPVPAQAEIVQQSLLASDRAAEARAQRFRILLYGSALVLLIYLVLLFVRLRANAAELRRKEIQLIQANKMTALGTLVSSVAHEINNPNQVVLTNAGMLATAVADMVEALDESRGPERVPAIAGIPFAEMREALPRLARDTEDSARRIEQIVDDLKHFARPGVRVSDWFDVNEVVGRALRLLTHVVEKRTDALRVRLAGALPLVRGNPQHLEQVAVNLIVNALEALPERSRGVTVQTRHDVDGGRVVLAVEDEGVGIPPDDLARLGEAFFTTKAAAGGTGLGVAIASSLVRLHGGTLSFSSTPGQGSCATVTLPVPPDAPRAGAEAL